MTSLYVHIGTPKTGTSSIQNFLYTNQESLKENGISHPVMEIDFPKQKYKTLRNGHFLVYIPEHYKDQKDKERQEKEAYQQGFRIIEREAKRADKIIVTDEAIWYRQNFRPGFWENLKRDAENAGCCLKVIVYLRRQDLYVQALWNQAVKFYPRSTLTFKEYLDSETILNHHLDYDQKLSEIAECIGRENLIVKVYEKDRLIAAKDGIYSDFLEAMGEEMKDEYQIPRKNINDRLEGNYIEIKRLMNELPEYRRVPDFLNIPLLYASNRKETEPVSYFDYQDQVEFLKKYESSNRRTAQKFLGAADSVLFKDPVEKLPRWEIDKETMYQDIICYITETAVLQQEQLEKCKEQIGELEKEMHHPLYRVKVMLTKIADRLCP